jgi:hypothetical protein
MKTVTRPANHVEDVHVVLFGCKNFYLPKKSDLKKCINIIIIKSDFYQIYYDFRNQIIRRKYFI